MSYDVVYERVFITTPLGYVPLLLSANSSCTTLCNGRRVMAKNWSVWGRGPCYTVQEFEQMIESICENGTYGHFKYKSRWLYNEGLRKFYRNGLRQSRTIEEITKIIPRATLKCCLYIYNSNKNKEEGMEYIRTTDALVEWIKYAEQRIKNKASDEDIYCVMGFNSYETLSLPSKSVTNNPVCLVGEHGYLVGIDGPWTMYSTDRNDALVFENGDAAADMLTRISDSLHMVRAGSRISRDL